MSRSLVLPGALVCAALLTSYGHPNVAASQEAGDGSVENSDAIPLDPITVEGGGEIDVRAGAADTAGTISIDGDDLDRSNATSLEDVFEGEAAVQVGGGTSASQKLYVNGIEDVNLAVSVDGARQNQRVFHHAGSNIFDPSLFKSVDVYPGPAPADAGPGALGGAVAFETVDAKDLLDEGRSLGGFATSSYETNGQSLIGGGALYGEKNGFEGLGYIRYGDGNDYNDGDGNKVEGTGLDLLSYLGKGAFESTDGHRLEASAERVIDDSTRPFRANIGEIIGVSNDLTRNYEIDRETYTAKYELTKPRGWIDPEFVLAYTDSEIDVLDPFGSEGSAGGWSGKTQNSFRFGPHSLVLGTDFFHEEASYEDPETAELTETSSNVGVFAQARVEPVERVNLSFGLRNDWQEFTGVDGSEHKEAGLSGNVFAAASLTDYLSIQGGYSNVFGGIAKGEPYVFNAEWDYSDIDPVRSENFTADIVTGHAGFTASAGVFRTDFDNARGFSFSDGPYIPVDFRSEGYRLSAGYSWGKGFARATYVDADLTLEDSTSDSFSLGYFGMPVGQTIGFQAEHQLDESDLTFGGSIEVALEYDDEEGEDLDDEALTAYDDYVVVDLYASLTNPAYDNLTMRFEVKNVLNADYATRATFGQEFESVVPLDEPGRSFILSAKITF